MTPLVKRYVEQMAVIYPDKEIMLSTPYRVNGTWIVSVCFEKYSIDFHIRGDELKCCEFVDYDSI